MRRERPGFFSLALQASEKVKSQTKKPAKENGKSSSLSFSSLVPQDSQSSRGQPKSDASKAFALKPLTSFKTLEAAKLFGGQKAKSVKAKSAVITRKPLTSFKTKEAAELFG